MIQCVDISLSHAGNPLFKNVSFSLNKKERIGLVGRNGSGKTTLLRLLTSEETPDSGTILIPKDYRLGYLQQHIHFTFDSILDETCLGLPQGEQDQTFKAEAMLLGLGFTKDTLKLPINNLSGGYQLRIHLAKVLLSNPDCLLLDEPTNYLDILSLRFLSRFLQRWDKELILISHDREFMDGVTTHTLGIHRNQVKKVQGPTTALFSLIVQQEEQYQKQKITQEKKIAHMQSFIDRLGAKATKAAQTQSRKKMLEKIPALEELKSLENLDFTFQETPFYGKKLLEASSIAFSYTKDSPLIKDVSLLLEKSTRVAIIGKNGSGKSTLLSLLARELVPQQGALFYADNISFGYFGQTNIQRLSKEKTVEEEIAAANPELSYSSVKAIAGTMMFPGKLSEKKVGILSGGEKSRVLLGKILAKPCNLLFLDEPTHHLDIESVEALLDALEAFSGAILLVTHSELLLKRLQPDALIICHEGRQEFFLGTYEEFLEKGGFEEESEEKVETRPSPRVDDRRARAEFVAARSRALKPLKNDIDALEKKIIALEEIQKIELQKLEHALGNQDTQVIQELVKTTGKRAKEIEDLFDHLLHLNAEYEEKSRSFKSENGD